MSYDIPWNKAQLVIENGYPKTVTEYCVSVMSTILRIDPDLVQRQLNEWWNLELSNDIHEHDYYSATKYWTSIEANSSFSQLREIIPRFLFLSASEASAERTMLY